ncbi:MAG: hypothetical protein ACK4TA_04985 [Saprospiraceae bacterium]
MARRYARYYADVPNAPSRGIYVASLLIGGLGILAHFVDMGELSTVNYWMLLIAYLLLVIGTSARGV